MRNKKCEKSEETRNVGNDKREKWETKELRDAINGKYVKWKT